MVRSMAISVMLAVGLELTLPQIREVLRKPGRVAVGLSHNLMLVPILAYGFGVLFGVDPVWLAVLVLAAGAPGGPLGALLTHMVRGNTAYAVVLIFLMALCSVVTVPLALPWLLPGTEGEGPGIAKAVLTTLLLFQLLPLTGAMALNSLRPDLADRVRPWVQNATKTLFVVVSVGMAIANIGLVKEVGPRLLLAQLATVLAAVGIGFALGGRRVEDRRALAMASGINNVALAFLVVKSLPSLAGSPILVALTYALMMTLTTATSALVMRIRGDRAERRAAREAGTDEPDSLASGQTPADARLS